MRKLVLLLLTVVFVLAAAAPAFADFKFGPHDKQCQASPDQPNCVGGH